MMKIFSSIFILIVGLQLQGQKLYTYADVAPTGKQNYLPYEGGSKLMIIDWNTPLDTLIGKLSENWRLSQTGKGYWIGYTNDMFSIAARNDTAISRLQKLIDTGNYNARTGAIYSLHLIGIDRKIAGRDYEEFTYQKARQALLYSLRYEELQPLIMELLIRDPRMSDVPMIFSALKQSRGDNWALVNGLCRYWEEEFPICQSLPTALNDFTVKIKYSNPRGWDSSFDFKTHWLEVLHAIDSQNNPLIAIEPTLFNTEICPNVRYKFVMRPNSDGKTVFFRDFCYNLTRVDYSFLGNNLYTYYVDNGKVNICSLMTAKQIVLDWWSHVPDKVKSINNVDRPLYRYK